MIFKNDDNEAEEPRESRWRAADSLTLKKMKYFLAVVESGKVTAAAREVLFVSPAVVAMAMRDLENFLGAKLFERRPDGMRPTREGERFRDYCEKILSLADDAARSLRRKSPLHGRLRIAASPAVHGYFLPPVLARFRRLFPTVDAELSEIDRENAERALIGGEIDVGVLLTSNIRARKGLRIRRIVSSRRALWCATNHRFAEMPAVPMSEIVREPYIQLTIDEAEENTRAFWGRYRFNPRVCLRTATVEAVRGHVGHGEGVTILSEMLFRPWTLEGDRLLFKPVQENIPNMEIGVVRSRRARSSPVADAFCDFLAFAAPRRGH